jgi:hypothetical protein
LLVRPLQVQKMLLGANGHDLSSAHPLKGAVFAKLVDKEGKLRFMDLRHLRCKPKPNDPARHVLGRRTNYTVQWEYYVIARDAWMIVPDGWMERIFLYYDPALLKKPMPICDITADALIEATDKEGAALDLAHEERETPEEGGRERDFPEEPDDGKGGLILP